MTKKDERQAGTPLALAVEPRDGPLPEPEPDELQIVEDLLIEDVSIDGMCGVY